VSDNAKVWRPILMDCTSGRRSCHGEKSAVLDLAAISSPVAYSIAAAATEFLTPPFNPSAENAGLVGFVS
jgi:hypothetical protein